MLIGLERINEASVVLLVGFDIHFSSGLNSASVRCLMGWRSCDEAEVLKPNCLVNCFGGLVAKLTVQG